MKFSHFDVIIVSSPAVLGTAECRLVGREADGFVLVAGEQMVRASDVTNALQLVQSDGQRVLGAVFNAPTTRPSIEVAPRRNAGVSADYSAGSDDVAVSSIS